MSNVKASANPSETDTARGVVELTPSRGSVQREKPRSKWRIGYLPASFVLIVILPIIAISHYFINVASDRYTASAGFAVRGIESTAALEGLGALTGLANSGSTSSDSYIILRFLESSQFLETLDDRVDLRPQYSSSDVDYLSRMGPDAHPEDFLRYWNRRIESHFDPTSGIIEFKVQSFSAEHAQEIAVNALDLVQGLVNQLSLSARLDSLSYAERELAIQEEKMRTAFEKMRVFRASQQKLNPIATAELDVELIAALESQLVGINSRIAQQQEMLDSDAPSLMSLRRQADAIEEQIALKKNELTGQSADSTVSDTIGVPDQLSQFEELEIERRFAESSYASALNSLEQARRDADRQQRYLAVFSQPQLAQSAEYPRRIRNIFIGSFVVLAFWSISTLLIYSIRDHLT